MKIIIQPWKILIKLAELKDEPHGTKLHKDVVGGAGKQMETDSPGYSCCAIYQH